MKTRQVLFAVAALCLASVSSTAYAQDDDDDGHIFVVSTHQWPFDNLDELFTMMEETQELVEQNEFVLSRKVLTHFYAGAFSVMMIVEYASLADIDKASARGDELFEEEYPDEADRDARGEKFTALVGAGLHEDNIVQENTALSK
jgi:hypothetical protein